MRNSRPLTTTWGVACHAKRDWPGAIVAFRELTALEPRNVWAHDNLGFALRNNGRLDEAIASFRAACDPHRCHLPLCPRQPGLEPLHEGGIRQGTARVRGGGPPRPKRRVDPGQPRGEEAPAESRGLPAVAALIVRSLPIVKSVILGKFHFSACTVKPVLADFSNSL